MVKKEPQKEFFGNKGWILIFVLIIISVCVGSVLSILSWVSNNSRWTQILYEQSQASIYFNSALKAVKKIFDEDDNDYDSFNDIWAKIPPISTDKGTILISIFPVNAKINLNMLLSSDPKVRDRTLTAIKNILLDNDYAEDSINYLLNWIDDNRTYDFTYYDNLIPNYKPRKKLFYSLKEVDYVKKFHGFSQKFHEYFTVNGDDFKININFAPKEVLEAYLPEISSSVSDIINHREREPFKNITQIKDIAHLNDEDYLTIQSYITTESNVFVLRIEVVLSESTYYATAIIKRNEDKSIEILKYFEGSNFYD